MPLEDSGANQGGGGVYAEVSVCVPFMMQVTFECHREEGSKVQVMLLRCLRRPRQVTRLVGAGPSSWYREHPSVRTRAVSMAAEQHEGLAQQLSDPMPPSDRFTLDGKVLLTVVC